MKRNTHQPPPPTSFLRFHVTTTLRLLCVKHVTRCLLGAPASASVQVCVYSSGSIKNNGLIINMIYRRMNK